MTENTHRRLQEAVDAIRAGKADCVLLYPDKEPMLCTGRGVKPLLQLLNTQPDALAGALLVDKIIGKAAAMLAALGGVQAVYALTASQAALAWLDSRSIPNRALETVPMIINRTGDGLCPLEQSVLDIDDEQAGLEAIKATVARLMARK